MVNHVTKAMLLKKLQEYDEIKTINVVGSTSSDSSSSISLKEKKITKIQGNKVICSDGLKAPLFSPMPCLFWKGNKDDGKNGVISLSNSLTGLFIIDEHTDKAYCIGIQGHSDEFEVRIQIGKTELRMNNVYSSLKAKHIIKNGLEEEQNDK